MSKTDEDLPLVVAGKPQWVNAAKVLGAVLAVLTPAVTGAIGVYRVSKAETAARLAEAATRAQQAKNAAEAGFQLTKDYVQGMEKRLAALEAAAKKAQPKTGRRPVQAPPPPRPRALPHDLNAAEAQVFKGVAPAPVPPRPDGGAG